MKKNKLKLLFTAIFALSLSMNTYCSAFGQIKTSKSNVLPKKVIKKITNSSKKPELKIAVFSDDHYFSPDLFKPGKPYETYLEQDRKLLAQSDAILRKAIDSIKASDAQVVLVTGDLTKDGELIDHQIVAGYLQELRSAGKKVYVIDGNHDINNPEAELFTTDSAIRIRSTSPEQFKKIYNDFGYSSAIAKDPNSLSYVVEPVKGFRIIAMDSCSYDTNLSLIHPVTGSGFTPERLGWIQKQIKAAKSSGATIVGMMHHGILEHFKMQSTFFSDYVIKNWKNISENFADLGMHVVFTGHFHAQDITMKKTQKGNTLLDIETGSLITYPNPYRFVKFTSENELQITSKNITSIDYDLGGVSFTDYSKKFLIDGVKKQLPKLLVGFLVNNRTDKNKAEQQVSALISKQVAPNTSVIDLLVSTLAAHYSGDESISPQMQTIITNLGKSDDQFSKLVAIVLTYALTDLPPADNNVNIDLNTGNIIK